MSPCCTTVLLHHCTSKLLCLGQYVKCIWLQVLKQLDHPVADLIMEWRSLDALRRSLLETAQQTPRHMALAGGGRVWGLDPATGQPLAQGSLVRIAGRIMQCNTGTGR